MNRTASVIAKQVGVDSYYAEVLPEDKANFVEQEKAAGHTVIMLGDGINDSPPCPPPTSALPSATARPLPGKSPTSRLPPTACASW